MKERIKEPCNQQKTDSCNGCPVISWDILNAAGEATVLRPSKVEMEIGNAASRAVAELCPKGLSPQTNLIGVRDYGKGLGGRTVQVYLKGSR